MRASWIELAAAAIVGAVLGLSGWFFLGSYLAEYTLLNTNTNTNTNTNINYVLYLVSWKMLQKHLLNLADLITDDNTAQKIYTSFIWQ